MNITTVINVTDSQSFVMGTLTRTKDNMGFALLCVNNAVYILILK